MTDTSLQLGEPAQSLLNHCLRSTSGEYDLRNWDGRQFPVWISDAERDAVAKTLQENGYLVGSRTERRPCGCRPYCNLHRDPDDVSDPCPGYQETHYFVVKATLARQMKLLADRQESPNGWSLEQAIARAEETARENAEAQGAALYKQCLAEMENSVRRHVRQAIVTVSEARDLVAGTITTHSPYYLPAEERVKLARFATEAAIATLTADGTVQASSRHIALRHEAHGAWPTHTHERMEILITW